MQQEKNSPLTIIALIVAMILWASSFVALKIAFRAYHPMVVIFGRMLFASIVFLIFFPLWNKNRIQKNDIKYLLLMAFFEPCLYFVLEAKALLYTSAAQAGMITSLFPMTVGIGAAIFLKEVISLRTVFGFLLAAAGAAWLSLASNITDYAPNPVLGNSLEFLAMVSGTGYALLLKKLTSRYTPFFLTAIQAFTGCIFFLPLMLIRAPLTFTFEALPFFSIVYLGIGITLGGYGLYNFGVSRMPASRATAFVNLIPVFGLVLAWLVLGETFNKWQYLASATVLAGVAISQK